MALLAASLAGASVEEGRARFEAYQETLATRQQAAARGDSKAYQAEATKAEALLMEAREAFESGGALSSDDPAVLQDYVAVLRAQGYDDLAAEALKGAIDRGVDDAAVWRLYGECLLAIGPEDYQAGIEALYQALDLSDEGENAAKVWFALGKYYLYNTMPDEASNAFSNALERDADYVPARLGRAAAMVYAGDVAGAGQVIDEVGRAAQPHDILFRGMVREALHDFDLARRSFADTAENHYAYARLLYQAVRLPEAVLAARRATDLAPENTDIWNLLGAIQIQLADYTAALEAYEASLAVNADQPQIAATVEQLKQAQAQAAEQQKQQEQAAPPQEQQPLQGQGLLR